MQEILKSFGIEGRILLWQFVNFGLLFLILWRFLYKPLKKVIKDREIKVTKSLTRADELEKKSQEIEKEFEDKMSEQRRDIEAIHERALEQQEKRKKEMRIKAEQESEKIIKEARDLAAEERTQIIKSVENEVKKTAVALASKILEKELDEDKQKEILESALKSLKETK